MNKVQEFLNEKFGEVRTVLIKKEPWFIAKDICDILGTKTKDLRTILKNKGIDTIDIPTNGGEQQMLCVNEQSLYKIIFKSRKPFAEEFQDWICEVVIPAIRKDGAYVDGEEDFAQNNMSEDEFILQAMTILQNKVTRLKKENAEMKPKVNKWNQFLDSNGTYNFTEVSKLISTMGQEEKSDISISVVKLTDFLRNEGVLSKAKTPDKPTKKGSYKNLPNKDFEEYFDVVSVKTKSDFNKTQTRVKATGVEYIYDLVKNKYNKAV